MASGSTGNVRSGKAGKGKKSPAKIRQKETLAQTLARIKRTGDAF